MKIPSGIWKGEGYEKTRKVTTRKREVCNILHTVILNLIIINLYINFVSSNVFQRFHRLSDTSKATKERQQNLDQQKLGLDGYLNSVARIVSIKKPIIHPNNKLQIIFILLHCKR